MGYDEAKVKSMACTQLRSILFLMLGAVTCSTGCHKQSGPTQNPDGTTTNTNGSVTVPAQTGTQALAIRNSDGSITNPDGSVTYPPGSAVANKENSPKTVASSPVVPPVIPAVQQSAPAPVVQLTVPTGTPVTITLNNGLAASRNEVGDRFSGVLAAPVLVRGQEVFHSGVPVSGEVVASKGKGRFKGAGDLGITLTEIGRQRVETSIYERASKGRGKRTAGFVGGGAGLGALIGGLAGGGKGALIGGLAGAGGGTVAGAYTGNRDVVIPAESRITFRLTQSVTR